MTVPKKPAAKRAPPVKRAPAAGKTAATGQRIVDAKNTGQSEKYGDDIRAAARALYEGDPDITKRQVATEMGLSLTRVETWSKGSKGEPKWVKRTDNMSERAQAAADKYKTKLTDLGPEITTEQQQQVMAESAEETAVEMRAKVLERHRKEWNIPRALVNEAVQARNFDKAKLAKITSETLKLVQDGERKAWGIDSGPDGSTKVQVVIERE